MKNLQKLNNNIFGQKVTFGVMGGYGVDAHAATFSTLDPKKLGAKDPLDSFCLSPNVHKREE